MIINDGVDARLDDILSNFVRTSLSWSMYSTPITAMKQLLGASSSVSIFSGESNHNETLGIVKSPSIDPKIRAKQF